MMPTYDPVRDGNKFEWVIRAAAQVREQRIEERERQAKLTKRLVPQPKL